MYPPSQVTLLTLPLVAVALVICVTDCAGPSAKMSSSDCDRMITQAEQDLLASFSPDDSAILRRELEGTRAHWLTSDQYKKVRARVNEIGLFEGIARLEIGRAPGGPGYSSVWFIQTSNQVFELATGPEFSAIQEDTVLLERWQQYVKHLKDLPTRGLPSRASPFLVDGPAYYFCAVLDDQESAFILYNMPDNAPQFGVVARSLNLSQFKKVPREFEGLRDK